MNRTETGATGPASSRLAPHSQTLLEKVRRRLYPYRPRFRDRGFWAVQALVLFVAAVHYALEITRLETRAYSFEFVPIAFFFVPVVAASLRYGFAGALATVLWVSFLSIPNLVFLHEGIEAVGELFQLAIVISVAAYVGHRVDREAAMRQQAEAAGAALKASEMKYRGLFESSPVAVLVLDQDNVIVEANPAARALVKRGSDTLEGTPVADLIGPRNAEVLTSLLQGDGRRDRSIALRPHGGTEVYLHPILTETTDERGSPINQVLLQDVTEERLRQAGLRAYAAHMLHAQEEERRRIAQELHDETVQALILLCRQLDSVEGASSSLAGPAIAEIREARESAEEVVTGLRDFARALRPPTLDDFGLVTAIRRLLEDLTERVHMEGHLKVIGEERRLPLDTELGMFRIAQEALRNIERHAQATNTTVTIAFGERGVRLAVADNGIGFSQPPVPNDFAAHGRLGLLGMQERAELLGGQLEIESDPGLGTRVELNVPTEQESTSDVISGLP